MFRAFTKPAALGVAFALLLVIGLQTPASADPGKGLRWGDIAFGSAPRGQPVRPGPSYARPLVQTYSRPFVVSPSYGYVQPYAYAPATSFARPLASPYPTGPVVFRSGSCR